MHKTVKMLLFVMVGTGGMGATYVLGGWRGLACYFAGVGAEVCRQVLVPEGEE
jgi:hypothetical protein